MYGSDAVAVGSDESDDSASELESIRKMKYRRADGTEIRRLPPTLDE
jgi:hypothetical protein